MLFHPACDTVSIVTGCGARGLGFKSLGSILTVLTETSSLSRVVTYGGHPCSVPLTGWKTLLRWTATTVQKTTPKLKLKKQNKRKYGRVNRELIGIFYIRHVPNIIIHISDMLFYGFKVDSYLLGILTWSGFEAA